MFPLGEVLSCECVTLVTVGECDVGLVTSGGCATKLSDILSCVESAEQFTWMEVGVVSAVDRVTDARLWYLC